MNQGDIAERLIRAAEIEQAGARVGPAPLRAQQLPYAHSEEDMRNWGHRRGERRSRDPKANACRLRPEDADAHALYRREFWEYLGVTARDVSEAEEAWGWYALVDDEDNRAALAAWVRCMADHKRLFFKDWCKNIGITAKTGRARKNRAIASIHAQLDRRDVQNNDSGGFEGFPCTPEIGDIEPNIAGRVQEQNGITSWTADDAFNSFLINPKSVRNRVDVDEAGFSWAAKRNQRRRQREAKKRKQEVA